MILSQANQMSGAPAASSAATADKKEEEAKAEEAKQSGKEQPRGGAWWQWLLVCNLPSCPIPSCSGGTWWEIDAGAAAPAWGLWQAGCATSARTVHITSLASMVPDTPAVRCSYLFLLLSAGWWAAG